MQIAVKYFPRRPRIRLKPTPMGFVFKAMVVAMFVASVNYGNNMAYILTFLLFSQIFVAFLATSRNIKELAVESIQPHAAFAGAEVAFTVKTGNRSARLRQEIYIEVPGQPQTAGPFSLPARQLESVKIAFPAVRRGKHTLSRLNFLSVYPMGFFTVRKTNHIDKSYIVYPEPGGDFIWPEERLIEEDVSNGISLQGGDDFVGVRPYRIGESQHRVDWKAVARGRPMRIKEFTGGGTRQLWFDWDDLAGLDVEKRLSQLTRWVLEADLAGIEFGLRIPGQTVSYGSGSNHTKTSLETLALFEPAGEADNNG